MKKIALILALPLVLSLAAVAAQKKDASKKSTESATSEQHVVLNPADLKWGDAPPGLPPGAKLAVLAGWWSQQEGTVHRAVANPGWVQRCAAYATNRRA